MKSANFFPGKTALILYQFSIFRALAILDALLIRRAAAEEIGRPDRARRAPYAAANARPETREVLNDA